MGQVIKTFSDGSFLEYDKGSFDKWCVYLTKSDGKRKPPRDEDYFLQLKQLADKYGIDRVYNDFVGIYNLTGKQIEETTLTATSQIANSYGDDALAVDVLFSTLYMAMISEEQKMYTKLGKRIKRLGVHMLLMENRSVSEAATFTYDMDWKSISNLCKERGF